MLHLEYTYDTIRCIKELKIMHSILKYLFFNIIIFSKIAFAQTDSNIDLEKITLQLQWKHQFEFAGFYAAKEKGFYKEKGFDVEFKEYETNINIIDDVLNAKAQYGVTYSSLIVEYLKGKPIVLMANFFKHSPLAIVAQPNIKSPKDLVGKKVMGVEKSLDKATILMMLKKFGIDMKDFHSIDPTFNIQNFIDKKVDAMTVFTTNETFFLDSKNIKYNLLNPVNYGSEFYDVNLFTSQNQLDNNPQKVKDFKEASIKGWEYALEHQDEIIDLILKKYNTQNKSRESLKYDSK